MLLGNGAAPDGSPLPAPQSPLPRATSLKPGTGIPQSGGWGPWAVRAGPRLRILKSQCSSSCHMCQLPRGGRRGWGSGRGARSQWARGQPSGRTGGGSARTWWLQGPHTAHGWCTRAGRVQAAHTVGTAAYTGRTSRTKAWMEGGHLGNAGYEGRGQCPSPHFSDGQTEGLGGWDLPSPPAQARACLPPRRTGMGGPRGAAHGPGRSLEVLPPSYELWASSLCPPGLGPLGPQSFRPGNRFVEKAAAGVASDAVCFHRS